MDPDTFWNLFKAVGFRKANRTCLRYDGKIMTGQTTSTVNFPLDPLSHIGNQDEKQYRRRTIQGILESYHGNYDVLAEAVQNAVDAVEDAHLSGYSDTFLVEVTVDLTKNWISILDTGIGMIAEQVASACAPNISFKIPSVKRDKKNLYRGYKGVGLTFLAYGTDDITIHSKEASTGTLTKARMQYGCAWTKEKRSDPALLAADPTESPLDTLPRGTFIKIQFSSDTRPRSLAKIATDPRVWATVLRTRTAVGQILLGRSPVVEFKAKLKVIHGSDIHTESIEPAFLYPSDVTRKPAYRFLDLVKYHKDHAETTKPPADKLRQDGLFFTWDTDRIVGELTSEQQKVFEEQLKDYSSTVYAFVPYQGSIWGDLNLAVTGIKNRSHLQPGLIIAVNRQRLADISDIQATRYETFSRNVLVIVHFDGAKSDQGRKTVEVEALDLANKIADRIVQYLAKQRELLRPAGESPNPDQREIERNHADWLFNVKTHAKSSPLHLPPISFISTPLTEQDVVGLFHQLSSNGIFAGLRVYATSQTGTYDCLIEYDCGHDTEGLGYSETDSPFGLSPYTVGNKKRYTTKPLTLEFKNNLDGLIDDLGDENTSKSFGHIDICVCWTMIGDKFPGFEIEAITETNLDERAYPGITHLLRRDGDSHKIGLILLKEITDAIRAGRMSVLTPSSN